MSSLIAKRYVNALLEGADKNEYEAFLTVLAGVSNSFENEKFKSVIYSPNISSEEKKTIILEAIKPYSNEKINSFVTLLADRNRLFVIPNIAEEIRLAIAAANNTYSGVVYSKNKLEAGELELLSSSLSKKLNSNIALTQDGSEYDGIKIEVEDLGVEVSFSQSRIRAQMIEHILKAI